MTIISDTSSISNLIQIDLLHILEALYEEIIITPAVKEQFDKRSEAIYRKFSGNRF